MQWSDAIRGSETLSADFAAWVTREREQAIGDVLRAVGDQDLHAASVALGRYENACRLFAAVDGPRREERDRVRHHAA